MKKIILSLAVMTLGTGLFAQTKVSDVAKLDNETINLGQIKQGNPTTAKFIVTNISAQPLIIEQANPTCGCTISDYTKEPIAPGKTGYINATYNAASPGHFDKHLTVKFAGIDEIKSITLTGDVVAADAQPVAAVSDVAIPVATSAVSDVATTKPTTVAVTKKVTSKKVTKKPVVKTKTSKTKTITKS